MFIGAKAQTFKPERIVGYGKADGLPRNWIDDTGMQLKKPFARLAKPGKRIMQLGDLIDHPDLFAAYPNMAHTKVKIIADRSRPIGNSGFESNGDITMRIGSETTELAFKRSLKHEQQHKIQFLEGFVGGADQCNFSDQAARKSMDRLAKRALQTGNKLYSEKSSDMLIAAELVSAGEGQRGKGQVKLAIQQLETRATRLYQQVPGEVEARATENGLPVGPHLQSTPLRNAPQIRQYSADEQDALKRYDRKPALARVSEALRRVFNSIGDKPRKTTAGPANLLKPSAHKP